MDKEEATRILAKGLGAKVERQVIIESSYKNGLVKNALSVYQIGKPMMVGFSAGKYQNFNSGPGSEDVLEILSIDKHPFSEANYFFLENGLIYRLYH